MRTTDVRAGNLRCQHYTPATFLATRSNNVPAVAEYEAWLAAHPTDSRVSKRRLDARQLRRIVQMRRNGCSLTEIGNSVGVSTACVDRWCAKLPAELAP